MVSLQWKFCGHPIGDRYCRRPAGHSSWVICHGHHYCAHEGFHPYLTTRFFDKATAAGDHAAGPDNADEAAWPMMVCASEGG